MKGLVLRDKLEFEPDYALPVPAAGESLVRVRRAGICNTDLELIKGYYKFEGVLGHEFVGELEDGTRVVGEINAADGTCATCRRGDVTHCENRTVLGIVGRDGAMAEYLSLPAGNLHPVPASVSDEEAVFVEPLAAALEIIQQAHIRPSDRVGILGDGKLGLLVVQVLSLCGCAIVLVGHHPQKSRFLAEKGVRLASEGEIRARSLDVVVDCTGQPSGLELARRLVRPRGLLVLKSTFHGAQELALAPFVVDEITILGSRCGPFEPALRLLERGLVRVRPLLEAEYPLERGVEAFAHAARPGTLKVQIVAGPEEG